MINSKLARLTALGALTASLGACGHLPLAKPAFEDMAETRAGLPADWTIAQMSGDAAAVVADYSVFKDAALTALVQEALENNRTLRATMENVSQAEALLKQTRSGLWPSLRAAVGVSATDRDPSPPVPGSSFSDEAYSFSATGAWNIDLMGDLSTSIRASIAGLRSTEATYELARRQLAAQVARTYFLAIEQKLQLEVDRRTLERAQSTYRITQTRFEAGSVARDELVLGESALASAEDAVIASEASARSAVRALEVLLGRLACRNSPSARGPTWSPRNTT
jgi:outer membrane protein TolC